MSIDAIKQRFINEIKLRGYDDKYIDKNEEREILQIAIQQNLNIDSARQALAQCAEQLNYVLESSVLKSIKDNIEAAMGNDGKVDEREFQMIFASAKKGFAGKKNDMQVKKAIVEIMEDTGMNKVKTGWFSNWYTALKKEVGMA
jgi:hypothetical protein